MSAKEFLISFFAQTQESDFNDDIFLKTFYESYKKDSSNTSLADFYVSFINKNKEFTTDIHREHNLTYQMIHQEAKDASKEEILNILGNYIKQASISTEEPTQDYSDTFRSDTTNNLLLEVRKDGITINHQPDADFKLRNDLLDIWADTEHNCDEFCKSKALETKLKKAWYFRGEPTNPITTAELSEDVSSQVVQNIAPQVVYSPNIVISKINGLDEIIKRQSCCYVCSGSRLACGGMSDQGRICAETQLYLRSSYSMAINQYSFAFPLEYKDLIVCPNVIVFKDNNYRNIKEHQKWVRIPVIMCPTKFKPQIQTDIPESFADYHLILDILRLALKYAAAFGYSSVFIDDLGYQDNQIPKEIARTAVFKVAEEFGTQFYEIILDKNLID